jgi:hypothetical protein
MSDNEGIAKSYGTRNLIRPFRRAPEGLTRINPMHILTEYLMKFHFNINLKYTFMSAEQWFQIKHFIKIIYIYIYIY